jgi:hypothetical protein
MATPNNILRYFKIILVGFKPRGAMPTASTCQAMLNALRKQFHVRALACFPEVSCCGIIMLDNTLLTRSLLPCLDTCCWKHVSHPPHTPDFTPFVFHAFGILKRLLCGRLFPFTSTVGAEVQK